MTVLIENKKHLGERLKQAQHVYRAHVDDMLRPLGISAPQYAALNAVSSKNGLSSTMLAGMLLVTPQTMQSVLAKLQKMGFLTKTENPKVPRTFGMGLTERGKSTLAEAQNRVDRAERLLLDAVGEKNAVLFGKMLDSCIERLRF